MSEDCPYCGDPYGAAPGKQKTKDHIIPKIAGLNLGKNNLLPCCSDCNAAKGAMTPDAMDALAADIAALAQRLTRIAAAVRNVINDRGLPLATASKEGGEAQPTATGETR